MRITGIGGTGVVTISQVLGVAAALDGLSVRGLDHTGLAQKGGPVVSDLKLAPAPADVAGKLASGECDLYLACDVLVGAEPRYLAACDPARTLAVVSTAAVPTGAMVADPGVVFPELDSVVARIAARTRGGETVAIDARPLSEGLFGSDQHANLALVGAAFQAGALPLRAEAIEAAIELNGVAVEANLQAFRRGRQAVSDPEGLRAALELAATPSPHPEPPASEEAAIAAVVAAPAGSELRRLVSIRVPELVRYQDAGYARRYADLVERVRRVEAERCPGLSGLAEAVAFHLHKLMAYKDEYEVARLALDPSFRTRVEAEFGPGARVAWQLHPPVLRALGLRRKVALGAWFRPAFQVLRAMRRLRHTALDPFGRTAVRRLERELVAEYEELMEEILSALRPANHPVAVELARLPELVRGYEAVKLASATRYRERLDELRPYLADS
jgi:indolepyruvate ferredoxin oxidoreductase